MSISWLSLISLLVWLPPEAREEEKRQWSNATELSAVWTGGNAESNTFGFNNDYLYQFGKGTLELELSAIRTESTRFDRLAVPLPDGGFLFEENEQTETTAENYFFQAEYDWKFGVARYWYGNTSWRRNELKGIANRYLVSFGTGYILAAGKRRQLKGDFGLLLNQEETVGSSGDDAGFPGLRVSIDSRYRIGKNAQYKGNLVLTSNLGDFDDREAECTNDLSALLIGNLVLKVSLELQFDNQPNFIDVPIQGQEGTVPLELDEFDVQFTTSLVISF
ncbi:MAG: DUF481 domain-containing protein [Acidobacteriota bacterium]|nr:DUF481 domain-containing protein [Acidobacteriota bacterium]